MATAATVFATWLAAHGSGAAVAGVAGMVNPAVATPPATVTPHARRRFGAGRSIAWHSYRMALLRKIRTSL